MAIQKQIRINPSGRIVDADRQVHVSQEDGSGSAHKVEFRHVGTGAPAGGHRIDFGTSGPFGSAPADLTFVVSAPGKVLKTVDKNQLPGVYKYNVFDAATNNQTDDPDVIVD